MKAIFEACTLWKKEICDRLESSEIQDYNTICLECKYPLTIEEKNCPVCGNNDLLLRVTKGQCGVNLVYNYNCEECGRILYSYSKFE